jgi:hypothetical protein
MVVVALAFPEGDDISAAVLMVTPRRIRFCKKKQPELK